MIKKLLLVLAGLGLLNAQTQSVKLTVGTRAYAVVTVCPNALCSGGLATNQFLAKANIDPVQSWRMVYTGATPLGAGNAANTVIVMIWSNGYTYTVNNLYVCTSRTDCLAQAEKLGVKVPDAILNQPIPLGSK